MKPRQAIVPFLSLIFKDTSNLLKSILAYTREAYQRTEFKAKFGHLGIPTVNIDDLVKLDTEIEKYTYLTGTSRPIDIALIKALCASYSDCNYLEIGSWRGESLYNAAQVSKSCTSISLSQQEMIEIGISERASKLQRLLTKEVQNIKDIEANSQNFDFASLDEKFDVIFIDGDHTYEGVRSDTANAFNLLKDENSIIIWHDFGIAYEDFHYEVISAAFDGCPEDKRDKIYRVSNTMCGIYTNRKLKAEILATPQIPDKTFSIHIKSLSYPQ